MFRDKRVFPGADAGLTTEAASPEAIPADIAPMTRLLSPDAMTTALFTFDEAAAPVPPADGSDVVPPDPIPAAAMATTPEAAPAPSTAPIPAQIFAPLDSPAETPLNAPVPGVPAVIFIDPSAAAGGDGSAAQPFSSWLFAPLVAGNIYLQRAGTVLDGSLVLRGMGTEAAPILVGSYGTGAPPVVRGSVVIEQSAHLILTGFTVEGSAYPAVIIRDGAHHITIASNTIQDSGLGIWFGAGSGGGSLVTGNTISGHATHGIAFDKTDHRADPTQVFDNDIRDNGSHGIELNGNGIVVADNAVSGNGRLISGSSGIHVYGGIGQADGFGADNVIIGNVVTDTYESGQGLDGNGIQLDQFTARNTVMRNIVSGNDGAGIILYDSALNLVSDNTLDGNALDRSASRPWLAELMLATSPDVGLDLTASNVVTANTIAPRSAAVEGVWVDALTADNANLVSGNTIAPAAAGTMLAASSRLVGLAGPELTLCDTCAAPGDAVWGV